jgi:hypothetical protein
MDGELYPKCRAIVTGDSVAIYHLDGNLRARRAGRRFSAFIQFSGPHYQGEPCAGPPASGSGGNAGLTALQTRPILPA